jgi:conjugal transfer pilus assembly protein TraE
MILGYVPSAERDVLKKALDIEAERIKKGGITTQFDTKEIGSPMMAPWNSAAL